MLRTACSLLARQTASLAASCSGRPPLSAPRAYAADIANVIATEAGKTRLQGYVPSGFIVNNAQVEGPVLCLPNLWLMWDVGGFEDLSLESLAVLRLAAPAPEVLVVGCGPQIRRLPPALHEQLVAQGIAVELLDTRNAISTFNFLNDEGRIVAAALFPYSDDSPAADDQESGSAGNGM